MDQAQARTCPLAHTLASRSRTPLRQWVALATEGPSLRPDPVPGEGWVSEEGLSHDSPFWSPQSSQASL